MTDRTSPLTQRVRRLLGTGSLDAHGEPPHPQLPTQSDSGSLFETHVARLSSALRELYVIDRQREAELRQLREQARLVVEQGSALVETIRQLDDLIAEADHLLRPNHDPLPTSTLFERMLARTPAPNDQLCREALSVWVAHLTELRARLAGLLGD